MLTVLLIVAMLIGASAMFAGGYAIGYVKAPTRTETIERHVCKYCNIDFTGLSDLDAINHSTCPWRTPEQIKELQKQAAKRPAIEASKDEYFVTSKPYKWYYKHDAPSKAQPFLHLRHSYYHADWMVVYRNGEAIHSDWIGNGSIDASSKVIIDLDKHRRRHKVS